MFLQSRSRQSFGRWAEHCRKKLFYVPNDFPITQTHVPAHFGWLSKWFFIFSVICFMFYFKYVARKNCKNYAKMNGFDTKIMCCCSNLISKQKYFLLHAVLSNLMCVVERPCERNLVQKELKSNKISWKNHSNLNSSFCFESELQRIAINILFQTASLMRLSAAPDTKTFAPNLFSKV